MEYTYVDFIKDVRELEANQKKLTTSKNIFSLPNKEIKYLVNKIERLTKEVNDHMDIDFEYKELIENELNEIKYLLKINK